jgi:hypothetical protein
MTFMMMTRLRGHLLATVLLLAAVQSCDKKRGVPRTVGTAGLQVYGDVTADFGYENSRMHYLFFYRSEKGRGVSRTSGGSPARYHGQVDCFETLGFSYDVQADSGKILINDKTYDASAGKVFVLSVQDAQVRVEQFKVESMSLDPSPSEARGPEFNALVERIAASIERVKGLSEQK